MKRLAILAILLTCYSTASAQSITQYFTASVWVSGTVNGFTVNSGDTVTGSFTINFANFTECGTVYPDASCDYQPTSEDSGSLTITNNGISWTFPQAAGIGLEYNARKLGWQTSSGDQRASFVLICPSYYYNLDQNKPIEAGFPLSIPSDCYGPALFTFGHLGSPEGGFQLAITSFSDTPINPDPTPPTAPDPTPLPAPNPGLPPTRRPNPTPHPPNPPIIRSPTPKPTSEILNSKIEVDGMVIASSDGGSVPQSYIAGEGHTYKGDCSLAGALGAWTIPQINGQPTTANGPHDQDALIGGWTDSVVKISQVSPTGLPLSATDPSTQTPQEGYLWYPGPVNGLSFTCSGFGQNAVATAIITVLSPTATVIAHVGQPDIYCWDRRTTSPCSTTTFSGTSRLGPTPLESNFSQNGGELDACSTKVPAGYGLSYKDFFWVQTLHASYTVEAADTTKTNTYMGLDAGPEPGQVNYVAGFTLLDNPGPDLTGLENRVKNISKLSIEQRFESTLMWTSPRQPSIPVPVSTISWGFDAAANYIGIGYWSTLGLASENKSYPSDGSQGQVAIKYPSWDNVQYAHYRVIRQEPIEVPHCP